jgi:hypothetical protein
MHRVIRRGHWVWTEPLAPKGEPTRHHAETDRDDLSIPDTASAAEEPWNRFGYWHWTGPTPSEHGGAPYSGPPLSNQSIRQATLRIYVQACRDRRIKPDLRIIRDLSGHATRRQPTRRTNTKRRRNLSGKK